MLQTQTTVPALLRIFEKDSQSGKDVMGGDRTKERVEVPLKYHNRYEYVGIHDRPKYSFPGGKKLAVTVNLNVELFTYGDDTVLQGRNGMLGVRDEPDVCTWAWKDYGNRVGGWRLLDLFRELHLPAAMLINTQLLNYCPELLEQARKDGHETVIHGRTNSEWQGIYPEPEEKALIKESTELAIKHEGVKPKGWLGPGLSQSHVTLDLLEEEGYTYCMDWGSIDDQPLWMKTRSGGKILAVPYAMELNDYPAFFTRSLSHDTYAQAIIDSFDEMLMLSKKYGEPLVMPISLHTFLVGQPLFLRHLRRAFEHMLKDKEDVWFATPGQIADYIATLPPGTVPGDGTWKKGVANGKAAK